MSRASTDATQKLITYLSEDRKEKTTYTDFLSFNNKNYMTYQLGGGIRIMPEEGYSFDIGYRFSNIDCGNKMQINNDIIEVDIKLKEKYSHSIVLGASVHF